MSNRLKGFKSHPANIISETDKSYVRFVKHARKYAIKYGYSIKHIGSKRPALLKLMMRS